MITTTSSILPTAQRSIPVGDVLVTFLNTLDSPETVRTYDRVLHAAFSAMQIDDLDQIDGSTLAEWRRSVVESGLAPSSQRVAVAALRSFLRFARMVEACRLPQEAVTAALRTPKGGKQRAYTILSDVEIARMLTAARSERDRAILAVLFGSGVRVSELVSLDVEDVLEGVEGGAALRVRAGKGNKPRTIPIQEDVMAHVRCSLAASGRTLRDVGPLFRAHDRGVSQRERKRLSSRSVNRILDGGADRAWIQAKHVSAHACRHTYAMRCLRAGASTATVATLLGHASPVVTAEYLRHLELGELREAVPELPTDE